MATDTLPSSAPRPPGSTGLPGIGETLAFVKDPFAFIKERRARYGRVFRTSLLGRTMVVVMGPEPLEAFYDPANVVREGANPANIQTLFGGTGVINGLDGAAHAARKQFVSAALAREAVDTYVPTMTRFVDAAGPPETHRCPGFDLTTVFMALFAARLVRGYRWTLPEQDLTPNWALVPPVPRDGLRAVVTPR